MCMSDEKLVAVANCVITVEGAARVISACEFKLNPKKNTNKEIINLFFFHLNTTV